MQEGLCWHAYAMGVLSFREFSWKKVAVFLLYLCPAFYFAQDIYPFGLLFAAPLAVNAAMAIPAAVILKNTSFSSRIVHPLALMLTYPVIAYWYDSGRPVASSYLEVTPAESLKIFNEIWGGVLCLLLVYGTLYWLLNKYRYLFTRRNMALCAAGSIILIGAPFLAVKYMFLRWITLFCVVLLFFIAIACIERFFVKPDAAGAQANTKLPFIGIGPSMILYLFCVVMLSFVQY